MFIPKTGNSTQDLVMRDIVIWESSVIGADFCAVEYTLVRCQLPIKQDGNKILLIIKAMSLINKTRSVPVYKDFNKSL